MAAYFSKDSLRFLVELGLHNERPWFEANKARYETGLRDPFRRLIADLKPVLARLSSSIVADERLVGGSMMRIHRDVRSSKD